MSSSEIYQEAHRLFNYEPETGLLIRKVNQAQQKAGTPVGCQKASGHLMVSIKCKNYLVHRVIWLMQTGDWPTGVIDHINQQPADNRWANLRDTTISVNQQNSDKLPSNNTSGYKGVCKYGELWRAQIGTTEAGVRKAHWLGDFATPEEASAAYQTAREIYHRGAQYIPSYFEDVKTFHKKILNVQDSAPHLLSPLEMSDRVRFIEEELTELADGYVSQDLTQMADALADTIYVLLGTAHMMGLPFDRIWRAVQEANMAKVRGKTKRGIECDAAKPQGWVGPEAFIELAIAEATIDAPKS